MTSATPSTTPTFTYRSDLPPPAARWSGFPPYNFVGGNNAPEAVPVEALVSALSTVLLREGRDLATYNLQTGPQGYRPLREFIADQLTDSAGMSVTADDVLLTSGSLQGMDLINQALLGPGDTVIIEAENYGGVFTRLARLGAKPIGVPVDDDGMCMNALEATLVDLAARGVTPKYIYTIPTVQNPTGTIMPEARRRQMLKLARRYGVAIFEDDCYADLVFSGTRPPAIHALDPDGRVVYLGSFSKSLAPALRVGYVVAPWAMLSRLLSLKTDAGSGALEQMLLGEYCPRHFKAHVAASIPLLEAKMKTAARALAEHFGTVAEFSEPKGGIFIWVKLPEVVDTTRLAQAAGQIGIAINPGAEWSIAPDARRSLRICFASSDHPTLEAGIAKLADVCFQTFGVPRRSGNRER
ncbi:MAG: PLP-dependent aminotransferase family protein [Hyphomicrobiaceae bacterium]